MASIPVQVLSADGSVAMSGTVTDTVFASLGYPPCTDTLVISSDGWALIDPTIQSQFQFS